MMRKAGLAALMALWFSGCAGEPDLNDDLFVGAWQCDGAALTLTGRTVTIDGQASRIAYIETGKNADYGLFTTDGGRYSIFAQTRATMTFHMHKDGRTMACMRT